MRTIGVLGGMGPQATVMLQQRLITAVQAQDDCDHVPLLIDMNPQAPSRLKYLLKGEGADPGPVLARMAQRLEAMGADALAMPCNTAHHFADSVRDAVDIPFIDMLSLTIDRASARSPGGATVGVLASPATEQIELFIERCAAKNLSAIHPRDRGGLLEAISRIKSVGADERSEEVLSAAATDCLDRGAQCLIVGCTEFSLIKGCIPRGAPVIDALDVLVDEMVRFSGATPNAPAGSDRSGG